jgi:hypothetical protein
VENDGAKLVEYIGRELEPAPLRGFLYKVVDAMTGTKQFALVFKYVRNVTKYFLQDQAGSSSTLNEFDSNPPHLLPHCGGSRDSSSVAINFGAPSFELGLEPERFLLSSLELSFTI